MAQILITGGAGNVGSALAKKLSEKQSYQITIVDNLLTGSIVKVPKRDNVHFIDASVNIYKDISPVFYANKFDYVFHFAAVVGVKRTLDNPLWVLDDIKGFENILGLCKNTGVKKVFFSSSSEVYGEPVEFPQNEITTPLNSRLPYAIVKNVGEAFLKSYYERYGLDYTIFRFFNTYGPNQSEDFVIPKFIQLAQNNEPITIYGDGSQTRTFCYINDNIDTLVKILEDNLLSAQVVNVGNDVEVSVLELAKLVIKICNSDSEIIHLPALKEGDMTRRCPDISKMKSILGRELLDVETGMKKYLNSL
ncbi:NAD-dependent epimerase/dehydratase family protein [Nonlabens sp.]|uniref:NAD-dependent epimerase/dehydratase family protein n=1 Tax=Nonlabens sp. TaxID=1888209 RepID=UPI003F69FA82